MNIRKFSLVTSAVIMFFLFVAGTVIMSHLAGSTASASTESKSAAPFGGLLEGIIQNYKPVNILVLGGDKVNNNTDTIMLVNYDPSTTRANVVSIPRDTKVRIESKVRKINFAYPHGGSKLAVETVSGLLGVNIKYFVYIDTSVFRRIIDDLGGIKDFYVPQKLDYDDEAQNLHIHLEKGYQFLDGYKAEQFMRYRGYKRKATDFYNGSDLKRIEAQQTLLKELVKQKANLGYIHKFSDVVSKIFYSLETNMKMSEIISLTQNLSEFSYSNVSFYTIPGTDGYEGKISYYLPDLEKTLELMKMYFAAEEGYEGINITDETYNNYKFQETETKEKEPHKNTKKKSYSKDNPSNSETNIKKQKDPEP